MNLKTKKLVHEQCLTILQQKIDGMSQNIVDMTESMMAEAKSTMGDKYETSRAMIQSEIERIGLQRSEAIRQLQNVQILNPDKYTHVGSQPGNKLLVRKGLMEQLAISNRYPLLHLHY